jgi:SPP1 gp7 family putative phage head morphogenesis protein
MSTPEALYRNAIDLNRYSNSVARRIINAYNDIIIDATNQLRTIDELAAPVKAARLRAILAQLKESLGTWAGDATELTALELQGLAELQSEFVTEQLRRALPAGARDAVRTVEISPQFAQSVVTTDPTQLNVVALSDDLFAAVQGAPATFSLTAAQGATITLPNGEVISKAFRGVAVDQAERFSQIVRQGLLTGETTPDIAKRLIGSLQFGEEAKTVRQLVAAGGQATAIADNQIVTLVRTSINQVANTASQQVYEANQDITKKYRYVATLDTRTSSICRALDGQQFPYGKGPTPPQHFNCLPGDALVAPCGRIAAVYRRRYEGFLYVIKTADGHIVRVTPNHPILTSAGWQPAQSINVGDQVFSRSIIPSELVHDCQEGDAVATAEDVFGAFRKSSTVFAVEVPTTAPDFHGDAWSGGPGVNLAKQVAVVLADRELLLTVNPGLLETLLDLSLKRPNPAASGGSHAPQSFVTVGQAALCSIGGSSESLALGSGSATHAGKLLLAPVAQLATGFNDDALDGTWRDAEAIRDAANTDALIEQGYDQTDVCWIGREPFSGHVYNFETETGTYCANSILTHNCRSTTVPVIDYEGLGFTPPPPAKRASAGGQVPADVSYGNWLANQQKGESKADLLTRQTEALGAEKAKYFRRLAKDNGPDQAIAKLVRDDGSELTLEQLSKRYGPA